MAEETWVYSAMCEHSSLLYVGITRHLERRLAEHKASKPWWPEVASVQAELFADRGSARLHELEVIRHEFPKYNIESNDVWSRARRQPAGLIAGSFRIIEVA